MNKTTSAHAVRKDKKFLHLWAKQTVAKVQDSAQDPAPWLHMNAALMQHVLWWLALGLIVPPFLKLPGESQSESIDESCNKSAVKADAGCDLVCFHHRHRRSSWTRMQGRPWSEQAHCDVLRLTQRGGRSLSDYRANDDATGMSASMATDSTTQSRRMRL